MNDELAWDQKVEEIFHRALERTPDARDEFLALACHGDDVLRDEVAALLEAGQEADGGALLDTHDLGLLGGEVVCEVAERIDEDRRAAGRTEAGAGDWIGNYRLLQQIGEGGFGVVWMAEQREPVRRRVALKIVKLGMDTKQVVARFEQERQALALMDHPHIARVFDAGATPEGRPYFVMELVRGIKITDYCDKARLPTEERIRLFLTVCDAVQHAHQKGIIHRDLKPSNILVTLHDGVPVPKVIDFGVAKATRQDPLTELTLFTQFHEMIGTPLYMSPEQAEMSGLDVDTRSDIYSLGVLLCELLAGRTPLDPEALAKAGEAEIRRVIREGEYQRPSTLLGTLVAEARTTTARNRDTKEDLLIKSLRGDLDWIVMKALERDRNRRYESAHLLAADLQRHLACEPVTARPPSKWYSLQRMVRRNKATCVTAAAVTLILLGSIGFALSQAARAGIHAQHARESIAKLRATAPAFEAQARALFAEGDLDGAIEQLDYAIKLGTESVNYRLAKADLLMADFRFEEAAAAYGAVLETHPDNAPAREKAMLCEKLHRETAGGEALSRDSVIELHAMMLREDRPKSEWIKVRERLDEITHDALLEMCRGDESRFQREIDGWRVDLAGLDLQDISFLRNLPISALRLTANPVSDLTPLAGMPLKHLQLHKTAVSDLTPVLDSPLAVLELPRKFAGDLSVLNQLESLESLILPLHPRNVEALRRHPRLKWLSRYSVRISETQSWVSQSVGHFWAGHLVAAGRYEEAKQVLREHIDTKEEEGRYLESSWLGLAALYAAHGPQQDYEQFLQELKRMAIHVRASWPPFERGVLFACLLRPGFNLSPEEPEFEGLWGRAEDADSDTNLHYLAHGLYYFRTGKFTEAVEDLNNADRLDPKFGRRLWYEGMAAAVRAMARFRDGNIAEAREDLARAKDLIEPVWSDWTHQTWRWHYWMMADLLLREAEEMMAVRQDEPENESSASVETTVQ